MRDAAWKQTEELELDLCKLIKAAGRNLWLILLVPILGAVLTLAGLLLFAAPQYRSAALFYVNNSVLPQEDTAPGISNGDLTTSRNLVDSYIVILNTRETLEAVIAHAGANRTCTGLQDMIEAEAVDNTEIFRVTVTGTDPAEVEKLANAIACILPQRISEIIGGAAAKVVASAAAEPTGLSYGNGMLLGGVIGLMLAVGIILLQTLFDTTVRSPEDVGAACTCPILVKVPKLAGKSEKRHFGSALTLDAAESYNLLRTMLGYSSTEENTSQVLGITSPMAGEGKSLSAVNLARAISRLDKKVLLIDCDMRGSSAFPGLAVRKTPGLSDCLSGHAKWETLIQSCGLSGGEGGFSVIASGRTLPDPGAQLGSKGMEELLTVLRNRYDCILLDLPPVGEVSDALAAARQVDGFLLVVRENLCHQAALQEAVRQIKFVGAPVLGVVYNCAGHSRKRGKRCGKHSSRIWSSSGTGKYLAASNVRRRYRVTQPEYQT